MPTNAAARCWSAGIRRLVPSLIVAVSVAVGAVAAPLPSGAEPPASVAVEPAGVDAGRGWEVSSDTPARPEPAGVGRTLLARPELECPGYFDGFGESYIPELVDLPVAELVTRYHPTLQVGYVQQQLGRDHLTNVERVRQAGVQLAFRSRLGRDFMVAMRTPILKETLTLSDGTQPPIPGTVSAITFELKHLIPYEVMGFRTAIGGRASTSKEISHPLWAPDEWVRLQALYLTTSRAFTPAVRVTASVAHVPMPEPQPLRSNSMLFYGLGFEANLFHVRNNYVRWIGEANVESFDTTDYNHYGQLTRQNDLYYNTALRVRSGIIQADLALRRPAQKGYNGVEVSLSRKF